jgi:hypothetical protein
MKLNLKNTAFFLAILVLLSSFGSKEQFKKKVIITNKLDFERKEIVAIRLDGPKCLAKIKNYNELLVKDQNGNLVVTQLIDSNLDGTRDELLFQATVPAKSKVIYTLFIDPNLSSPKSETTTYARFVSERIDDFAWENDRVAFRTYGPEAQRLVEEGKEGGTLSSGIDLWLKKVNYSIIDSWYAKNVKAAGYYHIEHGEGYDPYHVGSSRGTGGTGIWENDSLHISKNFTKYRVIATGSLRAVFELDYAPWSKYGVTETKRISLDLESNFSRFENKISATTAIPNYTLGITLHDEKGKVNINQKSGIFRHWEPIDDSYVGEGIVINPIVVKTVMDHRSKAADQSQILVVTAPKNNSLVYYVGFVWTGSAQVQSVQDWDLMLAKQGEVIKNPLVVKIK